MNGTELDMFESIDLIELHAIISALSVFILFDNGKP
jgi:hypothetical protein